MARTNHPEGRQTSKFLLISLPIALFSISGLLGPYGATASACTPDFALSASKPQTIAAGGMGTVSFTATSECGLYGTLHFGESISPTAGPAGISLHQPTYHAVILSSTHPTGSEGFQVITTTSTLKTTYTVTFTVTVLSVVHTIDVIVTVNGYTITVSPSTLSAPLGQAVQSTITLTSYGGYSSTVYYSISISPNPPAVGTDSCFNPVPGGPTISSTTPTATSLWTCAITPKGTYTVTITAMPLIGAPDLSTTLTVKVT